MFMVNSDVSTSKKLNGLVLLSIMSDVCTKMITKEVICCTLKNDMEALAFYFSYDCENKK
jgi:hypothetical protein